MFNLFPARRNRYSCYKQHSEKIRDIHEHNSIKRGTTFLYENATLYSCSLPAAFFGSQMATCQRIDKDFNKRITHMPTNQRQTKSSAIFITVIYEAMKFSDAKPVEENLFNHCFYR